MTSRDSDHKPIAPPRALTCVRAGLALVLTWPVLSIAIEHLTTTHTLHGLLEHEVIALIDGTLAWCFDALNDPLPAITQTLLLTAMTAIAFPRHHCHRHGHRHGHRPGPRPPGRRHTRHH